MFLASCLIPKDVVSNLEVVLDATKGPGADLRSRIIMYRQLSHRLIW